MSVAIDRWHWMDRGRKMGPVSWEELQSLARTGKLKPGDMVLREGSDNWHPARLARVRDVLDRISADIHRYIQIKSALAAMTCAVGYAVMTLVGVDFAGFWAVLIFFLYFIPTLGSIVAIAAPALLTLVQFATLTPFLIVLLVFGPVQILMANAVEPAIMGRSLNLSPLVIIGSLMLWGTIWGVIGMFLCVPIMVVLMIVLANFEQTRPIAILLSANGEVPRPAVD